MEYKLEDVKVKNLGYRYSFVGDMCVLWATLHILLEYKLERMEVKSSDSMVLAQ